MHTYDYYFRENKMDGFFIQLVNAGFEALSVNDSHGTDIRGNYLLLYISRGKGTLNMLGNTYSLGAHTAFLIPPDTEYVHTADTHEPWVLYWTGFRLNDASALTRYINYRPQHPILHSMIPLEDPITHIYNEMQKKDCNFLMLESLLLYIFAQLAPRRRSTGNIQPLSNIQKAQIYIDSHIHEKLKVADIAKESCAINVSQLYRTFMKETGISPLKYIHTQKINRACELIEKTDMSYHDIAKFMGFDYDAEFYHIFSRIKGITPAEYRRQYT